MVEGIELELDVHADAGGVHLNSKNALNGKELFRKHPLKGVEKGDVFFNTNSFFSV